MCKCSQRIAITKLEKKDNLIIIGKHKALRLRKTAIDIRQYAPKCFWMHYWKQKLTYKASVKSFSETFKYIASW